MGSLRGKPAKAINVFRRGTHVTAIAALNMNGIVDCSLITGCVNSDMFKEFVEEKLASKLQPFNGINPNSVRVIDNASIHHTSQVVQT